MPLESGQNGEPSLPKQSEEEQPRHRRQIIIDCDPGVDDAIAIMIAATDPFLEVLGITTVAGNVELEYTTDNALRVLDVIGRPDIPVAAGRDRPRVRELVIDRSVHGENGLGGPFSKRPTRKPLQEPAIKFIERTLENAAEPVTLIAIGPLTNMADVVELLPHLHHKIRELVIMGGAYGLGNVTPAAEFNVWVDPHAADVVFRNACTPDGLNNSPAGCFGRVGIPLTMVGLEVTHEAWLSEEHANILRSSGPAQIFVADLLDHFISWAKEKRGWPGAPIYDACTITHLIDPTLMPSIPMNVRIETDSELCIGRTVADRWAVTGLAPNCRVGLGIDRERFVPLMMQRLLALPSE